MRPSTLLVCCIFTQLVAIASAQDRLSAEDLLNRVKRQTGPTGKTATDIAEFQAAKKEYKHSYAFCESQEAADKWLSLFDKYIASKSERSRGFFAQSPFSELISILPGPKTWPTISKSIREKSKSQQKDLAKALCLFAELLDGKLQTQWKELDQLVQMPVDEELDSTPVNIYQSLAIATGDQSRIIKSLSLKQKRKPRTGYYMMGQIRIPYGLTLNEILPLVEPKLGEILIRRLLAGTDTVWVRQSPKWNELAKNLYKAGLSKYKYPHWELINSPEDTALYEAMSHRFSSKGTKTVNGVFLSAGSELKFYADLYYFAGLLIKGKTVDAMRFSHKMVVNSGSNDLQYNLSREVFNQIAQLPNIVPILAAEVKAYPMSGLWSLYYRAACYKMKVPTFIASAQTAISLPKLQTGKRNAIKELLTDAYLGSGQADKAIALMKAKQIQTGFSSFSSSDYTDAADIVKIGQALKRPDIVEAGMQKYKRLSAFSIDLDFLKDTKRYDLLLEQCYRDYLKDKDEYRGYSFTSASSPTNLAIAYDKLNRPKDTLFLLDNAPDWGLKDVTELYRQNYSDDQDLAMAIVHALMSGNHHTEAVKLAQLVISRKPGFDPAYETIVSIKGTDAIPYLDELFKADPFEDRPLIWKAEALRRAKRFNEAEDAARKALAVDPTDGNEPAGLRAYGYEVLAAICEAQGQNQEAMSLRNLVRAVRLAEEGDELAELKLFSEAKQRYAEATKISNDVYWIHLRLADLLMKQGQRGEAAEHYRKAYQAMPDQLGRLESECISCEEPFVGKVALQMSDQLLTELIRKDPRKPQLYYLLGQLRCSQARIPEAIKAFKKAVELDPDYLSAWIHLLQVDRSYLSNSEYGQAYFALVRLDPRQLHWNRFRFNEDIYKTANQAGFLAKLWYAAQASIKPIQSVDYEEPIYPLAKSSCDTNTNLFYFSYSSLSNDDFPVDTPGRRLIQNKLLAMAAGLVDSLIYGPDNQN